MFHLSHLKPRLRAIFHKDDWPRKKLAIHAIGGIVILAILWTISSLGQLRTFIPDYFKLVGTVFGDRTYLILFQNNYELRPTGGFISAYGVLEIKHGFPTGMNFYDVYGEIDDHDYIDPPYYPMQELLGGPTYGGYTFRDANYFVDFEDSANELLDFYKITNPNAQIDGILTMDFSALEDLVYLYEPFEADGYELTKNNLFETLEAEVSDINRHSEEELSTRKDIMKDIIKNLIAKITFHPWKTRKLTDTIVQNLNEKHIIMWFEDEGMEQKIIGLGWGDRMPESYEDLLAVSESNLGGMKNDRYIARNVKYEVDIQKDQIVCDLDITVDHYGGDNIPLSGDYKGYFRAFVPASAQQVTDSYEEFYDNYNAFGDIVRLGKAEQTTLSYEYILPIDLVQDGNYSLSLIKQPGTESDHYEIIVHTPQGSTLESSDFETHEEHAYFSGNLKQDRVFNLKINPDETSPRIHSHELVELGKIWIGFNEEIDCDTASDFFAYSIVDTDRTNVDTTDSITIDTITCDGRYVWLDVLGMTSQNEEFYDITMRNIRDRSSNYIDPNPRVITVVQRDL